MHSRVWSAPTNSAIVITFDENGKAERNAGPQGCCGYDPKSAANFGGGRIPTIVITNHGVRGVTDATPYNHYSLLRTTETAFGIEEHLRHAANTAAGRRRYGSAFRGEPRSAGASIMRSWPTRPYKPVRIQIIPMVDVMMFLLVFFVLISIHVLPALGLKVALPHSSVAAKLDEVRRVTRHLDGGRRHLSGRQSDDRRGFAGSIAQLQRPIESCGHHRRRRTQPAAAPGGCPRRVAKKRHRGNVHHDQGEVTDCVGHLPKA